MGHGWIDVSGIRTEVIDRGSGTPILYLHPLEGVRETEPWLDIASRKARIIAPSHVGFGRTQRPPTFRSIDDLAHFYLDLADTMELQDAILVGSAFGGWIAAEVAVRNTTSFSKLVLIDSFGIKTSAPDVPDIVDIYAIPEDEVTARMWHDVSRQERRWAECSDDDLLAVARTHEAHVRFGWPSAVRSSVDSRSAGPVCRLGWVRSRRPCSNPDEGNGKEQFLAVSCCSSGLSEISRSLTLLAANADNRTLFCLIEYGRAYG